VLNVVILVGRLAQDPELRYTPEGQPVASFTLAVNRPYKNGEGVQETDFIPVIAWRKLAEQATQYLTKGRLVAVEGRLQVRTFEDRTGQKRKVAEVVARAIRFLPDGRRREKAEAAPEVAEEENGDDVPF
jgi:single-strand DNA-binding protein